MDQSNVARWLLVLLLVTGTIALKPAPATGAPCGLAATASLYGAGDVATLAGTGHADCRGNLDPVRTQRPQPYFTHEMACSTYWFAAAEGICSATPCPDSGQFFAFRTIHRPDGTSAPAGFSCISLNDATATPGVSVAEVFAAIRRVKLPGGEIGVTPHHRGLANLTSYFWVQGVSQPPVELQVRGSSVQAQFRVLEYRWSFGHQQLVTTGPGRPGLESEVSTSFRRRGIYRVGVTVLWAAQAWLDGRRVGEVDDLVSQTQTSYPVAELRTVLTG